MVVKFANFAFDPKNKGSKSWNKQMKEKFNYYRSGNYIEYITRVGAALSFDSNETQESLINDFENSNYDNFEQYMKSRLRGNENEKSNVIFEVDWSEKRPFAKPITVEEAKKISKPLNNQLFADLVINPGKWCKVTTISNVNDYTRLIEKTLENFFKKNKIDPKQVKMVFSLHGNTEYIHAHVGFRYNNPINVDTYATDKLKYAKPFKSGSYTQAWKDAKNYYEWWENQDAIKEALKNIRDSRHDLKDEIKGNKTNLSISILDDLWELIKELKKTNKGFKFHMLSNKNQKIVINAASYFINEDPVLKRKQQNYDDRYKELEQTLKVFSDQNFQKEMLYKEQREYNNSIYNAIIIAAFKAHSMIEQKYKLFNEINNGDINMKNQKHQKRSAFKKFISKHFKLKIDYKIMWKDKISGSRAFREGMKNKE